MSASSPGWLKSWPGFFFARNRCNGPRLALRPAPRRRKPIRDRETLPLDEKPGGLKTVAGSIGSHGLPAVNQRTTPRWLGLVDRVPKIPKAPSDSHSGEMFIATANPATGLLFATGSNPSSYMLNVASCFRFPCCRCSWQPGTTGHRAAGAQGFGGQKRKSRRSPHGDRRLAF